MKKMIFVTTTVLALSIGGLITANTINNNKSSANSLETQVVEKSEAKAPVNIINNHAKTDGFNSLSELEAGSPIIVKGIKTGKLQTHVVKSKIDDTVVTGFTETEFRIEEVLKNDGDNKKIKVNKKISIGEKAFEFNNTIHTANGYKEMKDGKEYLLFLVEEDGIFAPRAVTFGKIPLGTNDMEIYPEAESSGETDEHETILANIFKDAREKYGK